MEKKEVLQLKTPFLVYTKDRKMPYTVKHILKIDSNSISFKDKYNSTIIEPLSHIVRLREKKYIGDGNDEQVSHTA